MITKKVTVIGATGTAGGAYIRALKAAGHDVRGTVRAGGDATALVAAGVSPVEVDLLDPHSVVGAIEGSDAVFVALLGRGDDPAGDEAVNTRAVFQAVATTKVRHVVYTSVHLADAKTGVSHFDIKGHLETDLIAAGAIYTVLRPTTFMDALDAPWLRDSAIERGVLASPIGIDTPISYLASDDLAQFAVRALHDDRLRNAIVPVGGPQSLTYRDIIPLMEEVSGRALRYEQMDLDVLAAQRPQLAQMVQLFNARGFAVGPTPLTQALGIQLTDIATFLRHSGWAQAPSVPSKPADVREV